MGAGRKICCGIMVCQMTAILSGVALMYLTVIVVSPSLKELDYNFNKDPIMCTTVKANDIAAAGKKVDCDWASCNEWCLSKTSSPCMQIYVMPRKKGSDVNLNSCELGFDEPCSALNVSLAQEKLCKKGECKEITGLFNCSKNGDNPCRDISPAYHCIDSLKELNKTTIVCDEEKCGSRLGGLYLCEEGECNKVEDKESYKDCIRKCENLNLADANTVLFSKERLITAKCSFANSTNNTISDLNSNNDWKNGNKYLFLFCSYIKKGVDENGKLEFTMSDCFNGTLRNRKDVAGTKSFLKLIDSKDNTPSDAEWIVGAEQTLRIMNDTKLKINPEGCVNTLKKECAAFFSTHATDGKDGKTPDRFKCFYTDKTSKFVIGKYDPELTYLYFMLASIVPATLFVVACFCLFFCSKSVGVDESGQLKVTLLKKGAASGNTSEL